MINKKAIRILGANYKLIIFIGLLIGVFASVDSFLTFQENIVKYGTNEEWRFYTSLASFVLFFSMFFSLILILLLKGIIMKFAKK